MITTRHLHLLLALALGAGALATARAQAPSARAADARHDAAASAAWNIPGLPALPLIIPYYDVKAYAWAWDTPAQTWRLLPRNEARVMDHTNWWWHSKQLIGTLVIDGSYDVPVVSVRNVLLLFRMNTDFKRFAGLPPNESGFEVTRLDMRPGDKRGQLIRTAQLQRRGESAATFGIRREPVTVWKIARKDGVFHAVRVDRSLSPGRYALYLPDRAFEFEVR